MVTLVKRLQLRNAWCLIEVTLLGMVYSVNLDGANEVSTPLTTQQRLSSEANFP